MSIDRDKVTELLKNYRSYKYAVSNGIAPFVEEDTLGMPRALDYGPRAPRGLSGRGSIHGSINDYRQYKRVVQAIDGAVNDVLGDEEQKVIRYKYMERNTLTLSQIADAFNMSERRALYLHKKALKALALALVFVEVPEIINLDKHLDKVPV
jgi:hypothetical protein